MYILLCIYFHIQECPSSQHTYIQTYIHTCIRLLYTHIISHIHHIHTLYVYLQNKNLNLTETFRRSPKIVDFVSHKNTKCTKNKIIFLTCRTKGFSSRYIKIILNKNTRIALHTKALNGVRQQQEKQKILTNNKCFIKIIYKYNLILIAA